ncbi:MAG TPA: hypothetical protein VGC22_01780 [Chitinophaga sp.]
MIWLMGAGHTENGPQHIRNPYAGTAMPAKMSDIGAYPFRLNAGGAFVSHKMSIFPEKLSLSIKMFAGVNLFCTFH